MKGARVCFLLCGLLSLASTALANSFVFTRIDIPGSSLTVANGVNDFGHIVGTFDGQHGFFKSSSGFHICYGHQ
jgi:hypothetical protein